MAKRIGGSRRKTRKKLLKHHKEKGKIKISRYFQEFDVGERVAISIEPAVHKGLPLPVFQGKVGKVVDKRGECYIVELKDGGVIKKLIIHPVHLIPQKTS